MKLARRSSQTERRPQVRAVDALVTETPQEEVIFDPQEFWRSPNMLELKIWLREAEVGTDLLGPTRPDILASAFWLARLDQEFQDELKKHIPTLKKRVEERFLADSILIKGTKNNWNIRNWTKTQHQNLISAIQGIYQPGEGKDLIQRMDIDFDKLVTVVKDQEFATRLEFAWFLVFEFPPQRERILSQLFESQERDPEELLKKAQGMSSENLPQLLMVFPEMRETLEPVIAPLMKELRVDYLQGLKLRFAWLTENIRFIRNATYLAILSAERTWIDQDGLLQFEFAPQRIGGSQPTLPPRSTL